MLDYSRMTEQSYVKEQYNDDVGLNVRKSLHHKYSTNKQGFGVWLFSQYTFENGFKVVELGSGNGDMWDSHIEVLSDRLDITLSDFSQGMVEVLQDKFGECDVTVKRIDIQNIPFEDASVDIVIANAMLYHVPNIEKAISEVYRILRPGGIFYSSTFGMNGLPGFIESCLHEVGIAMSNTMNASFTLQNGREILSKKFMSVERRDYIDSLEVTVVDDFVEYIYSMTSITGLSENNREELTQVLNSRKNEAGVIVIPKEYGMFISKR